MHEQSPQKLQTPARCALALASAYLIVLGCLLMRGAFHNLADGSIAFLAGGEEQAAKGYFFHVLAGLLAVIWYARGSRSKFPLAFAAISCAVSGMWTYICFSPTFFGLAGLIPAAFCGVLFGYRLWTKRVEESAGRARGA